MDTTIIITYLLNLQVNNNRAWFHQNKYEYLQAKENFEKLVKVINREIIKFDNEINLYNPKELTFKIMRDTRFSKDKSPYNPSFRAHIAPKGKQVIPVGYYIQISPNNKSFIGGGLFAHMFREATLMIREYIINNEKAFESILLNEDFSNDFQILGEKLKNVPKQYNSDFKYAELLRYKSFYVEYTLDDELVLDADKLLKTIIEKYKIIKPFNSFINNALKDFKLPTRR